MTSLHLDLHVTNDDIVVCEMEVPKKIRPFINNQKFVAKYTSDISSIPKSVYPIPILTTIAPVAWLNNVDIEVETLDETFFKSFQKVRSEYNNLYDGVFANGSKLVVSNLYENTNIKKSGSSATLFSGGVDSTATLLRHRDEHPHLITIHGSDVDYQEKDGFNEVKQSVEHTADRFEVKSHAVRSNFRDVLNYGALDAFYESRLDNSWWLGAHYGISLPGLCAPITYKHSIGDLYYPSGEARDSQSKEIVNSLCWRGTSTILDAPELSRQKKIRLISEFMSNHDEYNLSIRSCYKRNDDKYCKKCEKCYRTALGALAEGIDPKKIGYGSVNYDEARSSLESGEMNFSEQNVKSWQEIQDRFKQNSPNNLLSNEEFLGEDFFSWFRSCDLDRFETETEDTPLINHVKKVIVNMPYPANIYLWSLAKPIKQKLPF